VNRAAAEQQKRPSSRPENRPVLRVFQAINVCYARIYHRLDVLSPCRLPRIGPAILVSNHTSALDPLLIQSVCPRLISWMVAREYVGLPVLRHIFRMIEAIPVDRDGRDVASARAAMRALHNGRVLGVFPEGRIEDGDELLPFQTGVALMAGKTGVPVLPVYLDGTQRGHRHEMLHALVRPQRASVAFGAPISFARGRRAELETTTENVREAVRRLQKIVQNARTLEIRRVKEC
jgi:1-acyl-sn-glycerol-3-phosphate acyltransferase